MTHPHVKGSLRAMEAEDAAGVRRRRFQEAVERARAAGFSDRQAPSAAMAFFTIEALGGQATVAKVRARVRAQYPHLFDGPGVAG